MCDVKKYEKIYEDIQKLQPEDTLQLVLEVETEEQRNFYEMVQKSRKSCHSHFCFARRYRLPAGLP